MSSFKTSSFIFINYTDMDVLMSREVLECRNRYEIRKWMVNDSPISYENHIAFVNLLKHNDKSLYFSVLRGGVFVGSVNLIKISPNIVERGIYLHPDFWGKKLSKKICKELYKYIRDNIGITTVITKVFKDNQSSNALELSLGAEKISQDDKFNYYQCDLISF